MNNAGFLNNSGKVELTSQDFFDRIINLKFITGEYKEGEEGAATKRDEYFVRSDYEVVYPNLDVTKIMKEGNLLSKKYYIRRCRIKPSIKVQYKNVSSSTSIEIDIFVTNFFMLDSSGQQLMAFNNADYPIRQVEIMLGYWGQFKNLPHESFNDLKNFDVTGYGIEKITMNVQYATIDKLPPDYTLHIHGFVGNNPYASSVGKTEASTLESVANEATPSTIEELFFENITRRFIKSSVLEKVPVAEDGKMSVDDARKYGIVVHLSKGVKDIKFPVDYDSTGSSKTKEFVFHEGETAENTFVRILSFVSPVLEKKQLINGDWVVFTTAESKNQDTLGSLIDVNLSEGTAVSKYEHALPAVYNVNVNALSTIVAPFFYFINVFDYVIFENRYATTSLVAYYARKGKPSNRYFVIQQSVSFATVEDVNEMTLSCVLSLTGS